MGGSGIGNPLLKGVVVNAPVLIEVPLCGIRKVTDVEAFFAIDFKGINEGVDNPV
jgi:hypothetical protein